jgi:hypothetical protein
MKTQMKPLLAALTLAAMFSTTQAATFERVNFLGSGGYSAETSAQLFTDSALDLSGATGDVTLFGANGFTSTVNDGLLSHSYAADAFMTFSPSSTGVSMSLSQSLSATAAGNIFVQGHTQKAFIDLSSVTLKIAGNLGETNGSAVNVSFAGSSSALMDFNHLTESGYVGLGLSVSRGSVVVGEYLWDAQASGAESISFNFGGVVGEELTFSSYMLTGVNLSGASFLLPSLSPYVLAESGASLNGSFTIAAVPEPETYAMLMAGLALLGFAARRRKV